MLANRTHKMAHTRKGMTTLLETVLCVALFSMLMTFLLMATARMSIWSAKSSSRAEFERDLNFLMATVVEDIKSASDVVCEDGTLMLVSDSDAVVYKVDREAITDKTKTLYRDNEIIISGVIDYSFDEPTESMVRVYLSFDDGQNAEFSVRR